MSTAQKLVDIKYTKAQGMWWHMVLTSWYLPNIYHWLSLIASSHKYVCHPLRPGLQKLFIAFQNMNIGTHCLLQEEAPTFWKVILKSVIWPSTPHTEVIFSIFDANWENITWCFYCPSVLLTMLFIYTWCHCKHDGNLWLESWWSPTNAVSLSECVIKPPPTHGSQPRLQKLLLSEQQQMQKLTAACDVERKWLRSVQPKWDSHTLFQGLENISENDEVRL